MNYKKVEKWVKIDAVLQEKLKELEILDKQRQLLISKAEKMNVLTPEIKQELDESLKKYEKLAIEVANLKKSIN